MSISNMEVRIFIQVSICGNYPVLCDLIEEGHEKISRKITVYALSIDRSKSLENDDPHYDERPPNAYRNKIDKPGMIKTQNIASMNI